LPEVYSVFYPFCCAVKLLPKLCILLFSENVVIHLTKKDSRVILTFEGMLWITVGLYS